MLLVPSPFSFPMIERPIPTWMLISNQMRNFWSTNIRLSRNLLACSDCVPLTAICLSSASFCLLSSVQICQDMTVSFDLFIWKVTYPFGLLGKNCCNPEGLRVSQNVFGVCRLVPSVCNVNREMHSERQVETEVVVGHLSHRLENNLVPCGRTYESINIALVISKPFNRLRFTNYYRKI